MRCFPDSTVLPLEFNIGWVSVANTEHLPIEVISFVAVDVEVVDQFSAARRLLVAVVVLSVSLIHLFQNCDEMAAVLTADVL